MAGMRRVLQGSKGTVDIIEYAVPESQCSRSRPSVCALLLPGTSIRPGPGAPQSAKYLFDPEVHNIYRTIARELASVHGVPSLQLCWHRFPADGGTTSDAIHDMEAALCYARAEYGKQCGALLVGYSFGGAAIWALLAHCFQKPDALAHLASQSAGKEGGTAPRQPWLLGCVALSGALKGPGDDLVNLFGALRYLDSCHAPLLIVHGSDDDNVSLGAATKLYRLAPPLKSLCVLEGADHNLRDPHWARIVADLCGQWLAKMSLPRGCGSGLRAKGTLLAHHSGALQLLKQCGSEDRGRMGHGGSTASTPLPLSSSSPTHLSSYVAAFAFDPTPRSESGGFPSFRSFNMTAAVEQPFGGSAAQQDGEGLNGEGQMIQSRSVARSGAVFQAQIAATAAARSSKHLERQSKAREIKKLERTGSLPSVLEKFKASRRSSSGGLTSTSDALVSAAVYGH